MMLSLAELDLHTTLAWFFGLLSVFIFLCMVPLRQAVERLQAERQRLEARLAEKQGEVAMVRESASAWRTEMQRQFDATRADASSKLADAEGRAAAHLAQNEQIREQSSRSQAGLQAALDHALELSRGASQFRARVKELEGELAEARAKQGSAMLHLPPLPSLTDDREVALRKALRLAEIRGRNRAQRGKVCAPRSRGTRTVTR